MKPVLVGSEVAQGLEGTWAPLVPDSDAINYNGQGTTGGYIPGQQDQSMGDGSYIHDWTYENVSIKSTSVFPGAVSKLGLELQGNSSNPSGLVEKGDDVNYRITLTNSGSGFASNVEIKDTLSSIMKYVEDPSSKEVKIMVDGKTIKYTVRQLMDGIVIPILDAGASVQVEFSVKAKTKMPTSFNKKDFLNEASAKAECATGDVYNSCEILYATNNLKLRVPGNPGLEIDNENSINGGMNRPGGSLIDALNKGNKPGWVMRNGQWIYVGNNVNTGVGYPEFTVVAGLSFAIICSLLVYRYKQRQQ